MNPLPKNYQNLSPETANSYLKAIEGARQVLKTELDEVKSDEIHKLKSIFYAAVEQLNVRADRLFSLQRQLREIFTVINMRCDLCEFERQAALKLIDEVEQKIKNELSESARKGGI